MIQLCIMYKYCLQTSSRYILTDNANPKFRLVYKCKRARFSTRNTAPRLGRKIARINNLIYEPTQYIFKMGLWTMPRYVCLYIENSIYIKFSQIYVKLQLSIQPCWWVISHTLTYIQLCPFAYVLKYFNFREILWHSISSNRPEIELQVELYPLYPLESFQNIDYSTHNIATRLSLCMLYKQFTKVNVVAAEDELFIWNLFYCNFVSYTSWKEKDIKLRKYCSQAKSHQIIYTFFLSDIKQVRSCIHIKCIHFLLTLYTEEGVWNGHFNCWTFHYIHILENTCLTNLFKGKHVLNLFTEFYLKHIIPGYLNFYD